MTGHISYLEDGWVLWSNALGTDEGLMVYAQLSAESEGSRSELTQLVVKGRNLTTDRFRSIPIGHIETLASTNPNFGPHVEGTPQSGMGEALDEFHMEANQAIVARWERSRKPRKPLSRPDGSDPDAFYRQVADAYRDVVQDTNKVAKVLAEEAGVPVGTVHRWILESRRRGFLPPARQGRAG